MIDHITAKYDRKRHKTSCTKKVIKINLRIKKNGQNLLNMTYLFKMCSMSETLAWACYEFFIILVSWPV